MNVLALVGSLRKESYNMQLALTIQERYKEKMDMTIADISVLPHFNQDEEHDPPRVPKPKYFLRVVMRYWLILRRRSLMLKKVA